MKRFLSVFTIILLLLSLGLNVWLLLSNLHELELDKDRSLAGHWTASGDEDGSGVYILTDGSVYKIEVREKEATASDPYDSYVFRIYYGKIENSYIAFEKSWHYKNAYSEDRNKIYYHELGDISETEYADCADIYRVEQTTSDSFILWRGETLQCYVRRNDAE